jgi:hypothetical protein
MSATFPVFGPDGEEGELSAQPAPKPRTQDGPRLPGGFRPVGQQAPSDHEFFHYRDPSREAAEKEAKIDEAFRLANPELHAARATLARCRQTTEHYAAVVNDFRIAVSQKVASTLSTSAVSPPGTQHERRHELSMLQSQLAEAEAEHAASVEELEAARLLVNKLTGG